MCPPLNLLILVIIFLFYFPLTNSAVVPAEEGGWIQVFKENGNWLSWGSWGGWSGTCGVIMRSRARICAEPKFGGLPICADSTPGGFQTEDQVLDPCPGRLTETEKRKSQL